MHVNTENKLGKMVLASISTSSHYQVLIIKFCDKEELG